MISTFTFILLFSPLHSPFSLDRFLITTFFPPSPPSSPPSSSSSPPDNHSHNHHEDNHINNRDEDNEEDNDNDNGEDSDDDWPNVKKSKKKKKNYFTDANLNNINNNNNNNNNNYNEDEMDREVNREMEREKEGMIEEWREWGVKGMVGVMYLYAGIWKVNEDWLMRGEPLHHWLINRISLFPPIIYPIITSDHMSLICSRMSMAMEVAFPIVMLTSSSPPFLSSFLPSFFLFFFFTFHVINKMIFGLEVLPIANLFLLSLFLPPRWLSRSLSFLSSSLSRSLSFLSTSLFRSLSFLSSQPLIQSPSSIQSPSPIQSPINRMRKEERNKIRMRMEGRGEKVRKKEGGWEGMRKKEGGWEGIRKKVIWWCFIIFFLIQLYIPIRSSFTSFSSSNWTRVLIPLPPHPLFHKL